MEEALAKLIYDNDFQGIDFIYKAFDIIQSYYGLSDVELKHFVDDKRFGCFNAKTNSIYVNSYGIIQYYAKNYHNYNIILLSIIKTLLHEFEHARHLNAIEDSNPVEEIIIKREIKNIKDMENITIRDLNGIIDFLKLNRKSTLIDKLYRYSPSERLARINSCTSVDIISKLLKDKESRYFFIRELLNEIGFGYSHYFGKIYGSPTIKYFKKFGIDIKKEIVGFECNLSEYERMIYGLDVNSNELLENINQKLKLFDKKR